MGKLLLFSLLVLSAASFAQVLNGPAAALPADSSSAADSVPFAGVPQGQTPLDDISPAGSQSQDRLCLRIRAFIFKTDDDRVPQLVRETTCMPATAGAKKVGGAVQPKVIPAPGQRF